MNWEWRPLYPLVSLCCAHIARKQRGTVLCTRTDLFDQRWSPHANNISFSFTLSLIYDRQWIFGSLRKCSFSCKTSTWKIIVGWTWLEFMSFLWLLRVTVLCRVTWISFWATYDAICVFKVQADLIPVNKVLASTQSRHAELDLWQFA